MEGEAAARRFLALLERRPWLERRHGLFANGAYSGSLAATTRNNLGARLLAQGRLAAAGVGLEETRRLDDRDGRGLERNLRRGGRSLRVETGPGPASRSPFLYFAAVSW